MARAAVIPPASSPQRTSRTAKRTTTTTSRSGPTKPAAKTTKAKAPISATESRKRTARTNLSTMCRPADDNSDDDTDDELGMIDTKEKPSTKPRGRPTGPTTTSAGRGRKATTTASRKAGTADENQDHDAHTDEKKRRVGRPRAKATKAAQPGTAPKQRGRPKGSTNAKSASSTAVDAQKKTSAQTDMDTSSEEGPKELTITTNSAIMRSNLLRGPAKKKTVTFKDVSDSEDTLSEPSPPPAGRRRVATTSERPAGLGAKPARKASTTAGRGRKPAATKKGAAKPLSPKKATQVAKGISSYASSDGEDDELSAAKDQTKIPIDSPGKHGSGNIGLRSPVKRINFTSGQPHKTVDENGEPTLKPPKSIDFSDTNFMSSPARRPPPSPFSYTVRETPRRGGFALRDDANPIVQPNLTPTTNSPLKLSPKKANLETPRRGDFGFHDDLRPLSQPNFTPGRNSPLKSSPKKGIFDASLFSQPSLPETSTPLKRSLLQSPAKRVASPFKSSLLSKRSPVTQHLEFDSDNDEETNVLSSKAAGSPFWRHDSEETIEMPEESEHFNETPVYPHVTETPEAEAEAEVVDKSKVRSYTPEYEIEDEIREQPLEHDGGIHEEVLVDMGVDHVDILSEPDVDAEHITDDFEEPTGRATLDRDSTAESEGYGEDIYELFEGQNAIVENILMEDRLNAQQDYDEEQFEEYNLETSQEHTVCLEVAEENAYASGPDMETASESGELEPVSDDDRNPVALGVEEDIAALEVQHGDESEDQSYEFEADYPAEELQEPIEFSSRESMLEGLEDVFTEGPTTEVRGDVIGTESPAQVSPAVGSHNIDAHNEYDEEVDVLDDYKFDEEEATLVAFDTPRRTPRLTPGRTSRRTQRRTPGRTSGETPSQAPREMPRQTPQRTPGRTSRQMPGQISEEMPRPTPRVPRQTPRRTPGRTSTRTPRQVSEEKREPTPRQVPRQTPSPMPTDCTVSPQVFTPYEIEEPPTPHFPIFFPSFPSFFPSFAPPGFPEEYRDNVEETMNVGAGDLTPDASISAQDVRPSPQPEPHVPSSEKGRRNRPRFTLLAEQLSQWKATSPEKAEPRRSGRRGIFSLSGNLSRPRDDNSVHEDVSYPDLSAEPQSPVAELQPNDDIAATEEEGHQEEPEMGRCAFEDLEKSPGLPMFEIFSDQDPEELDQVETHDDTRVSIVFESPVRPAASVQELLEDDKENYDVQLPAPVTPVRMKTIPTQTFHTVSKVPLKPEGEISPLKMSRKRGRSLSITSPTRSSPRLRNSIIPPRDETFDSHPPRKAPRLSYSTMPQLQPNRSRSSSRAQDTARGGGRAKAPPRSPSPAKSPRRRSSIYQPTYTGPLQGAVVYVDVHTTEGEDASGIFVELLQQMGARCIKNWSWNPRSSVAPYEQTDSREGKVGITHVVYKDGGVRTMEKVRHARGVVKCVGVGWVLDCERESKWLDETQYTVDSSIIPRGGAKRRKSMEPRALSNINGTLVQADTTSTGSRRSGVGAVSDAGRFATSTPHEAPSTPKRNRKSGAGYPEADQKYFQTPKTPGFTIDMDAIGMSPATPFFLSQRSKLVQQTCPPKQLRQGLFSNSGPSEEQSQKLRAKLEAARRKSLAFKPKIGSRLVE
ncbi:hypothetical protein BDV23DRAFT_147027 [Aspergillus alliaceus]|uniref:BRCT domain-containing protein n=1 Tax=Petromyces alliaceus TaxID=209559 RepID=A0A5N7CKW2_PETAA|nr:hypothetical protein BDV23DRAFT_147027 [Aspergillus alliaceus]